jgi:DME family drug/metabolite transporter
VVTTKNSSNHISIFKVLLSATLFGTAGTAVTYAPEGASSAALGLSRIFFGALFLILFLPKLGGDRKLLAKLIKHPMVLVMGICSASYQPYFFGATERNGVAISTLLTVGCIPIFTGIVGRIFLKEPIKKSWVVATAIAIAGLTIRSWGEIEFKDITGVLMALAAGLSVSFYLNSAKVELRKGKHQMELPAMAYLLGSIFLIPLLLGQSLSWVFKPSGILVALYLDLVTMAIANALQISGLNHISAGPTATFMLVDPLPQRYLAF